MADDELSPTLDGHVGRLVAGLGTLNDEEQALVLARLSKVLGKTFSVAADSGVRTFEVSTSDDDDTHVGAKAAGTTKSRRR